MMHHQLNSQQRALMYRVMEIASKAGHIVMPSDVSSNMKVFEAYDSGYIDLTAVEKLTGVRLT